MKILTVILCLALWQVANASNYEDGSDPKPQQLIFFLTGCQVYTNGDGQTDLDMIKCVDIFEEGGGAYQKGNYQTAYRLWRTLAEQGNAEAQHNLAVLHYYGKGVVQDYNQAYAWWTLAIIQGNPLSIRGRNDVAKFMTPPQVAEAQALAREWFAKYNKD